MVTCDIYSDDPASVNATVEVVVDAVVEYNLAASDLDVADLAAVAECDVATSDLGVYKVSSYLLTVLGVYKASSYLLAVDLGAETATDDSVELVVDAVVAYALGVPDLEAVDKATVTATDERGGLAVVQYDVAVPDLEAVDLATVTATDERAELVIDVVAKYDVAGSDLGL